MEKCQRCGEDGLDRRTLWMACLYQMNEIGLPFEERMLFHANPKELTRSKEPMMFEEIILQAGTVKCSGELTPLYFFTLRVCKSCRSDWMSTIRMWFFSKGATPGNPGEGV